MSPEPAMPTPSPGQQMTRQESVNFLKDGFEIELSKPQSDEMYLRGLIYSLLKQDVPLDEVRSMYNQALELASKAKPMFDSLVMSSEKIRSLLREKGHERPYGASQDQDNEPTIPRPSPSNLES